MKRRKYLINILIRIGLIILFTAGATWSFMNDNPLWISIVVLLFIALPVMSLVIFLNQVNRQVNYFFEAVKNEDFTLRVPRSPGNKQLEELYNQMDEVNRHIQKAYVEIRQMEKYFQSMIEHAATGIFSFDGKGFVVHANSAFHKIIGRDLFSHIRQLEQVDPELYKAVLEIKPAEQRLVSFRTDRGKIQLSVKAVSFSNPGSDLMLLAVQDIRQALDEKELDSWLKLIRVLMHEIMNSIAPITSLADTISESFKENGHPKTPGQIDEKMIATTIRGLEVIREQGKGLTAFVESYRKLTRLPAPVIKEFSVTALVEDCLMFAKSMENASHIDISAKYPDGNLTCRGDEQMLKQVLVNLLQNSVQALENRQNAKIEIKVSSDEASLPEISVRDNGPGIQQDVIDQIFVPFFTTRANGSGIGLSLSRQIMRLHGGSLTVYSVPDKETVFYMRLHD